MEWNSSSYKNLLITAQARLVETTVLSDDVTVQFNGDASAVYSYLADYMNNPGGLMTAPTAGTAYAGTSAPIFRLLASLGGAAVNAGGGFAVIPNYSGATLNKTFYSISGGGDGTSSFVDLRTRVGSYNPSSQLAISAVSITAPSGGFTAGGFFGLYAFG